MAAPWHGKNASALFSGSEIYNLRNWTLTLTQDEINASALGDEWQKRLAGLKDFSVNASGLARTGFNPLSVLGTSADLKLSFGGATEPYLQGMALLTEYSETVPYDGEATCQFTFDGNGSSGLTYTATGGTAASGQSNAFSGKSASAQIDSTTLTGVREWTLNLRCEAADISAAMDSGFYRSRLAGLKSATATITALASGSPLLYLDNEYSIKLYRTSSTSANFFGGTAILTNIEHTVDVNEEEVITYTFAFTGEVEYEPLS
ncbi:MAG TPA: phage tail tube protein [Anaerohalosphaeraceae bacterium]|nr:phage tail tube protein [Anaerohalosphaeraceae bacterium]HQG06814.1 phage tail tube protein [Anaerohalosphaeraceae bacterium]HQI08471.1 phage tail tube protein [Anaerohalosphaeraceae bacterium]HQJ68909.1 phage tail tube protein [Anaerohalosphaeraceae bacterium]